MLALAMTVGGIYVLFKGEVSLTASKIVRGWRARIIGGILASYFPLAFSLGLCLGIYCAMKQIEFPDAYAWGIDLGVMAVNIVSAVVLGILWGKSREEWDREASLADISPQPFGEQQFLDPNQPLPPPSGNPYQSPFNR